MNGNGCAGSIASGVSTGNTRSMNQASSQIRSSSDIALASHSTIPAVAHLGQQLGPDALLVGDQGIAAHRDLGQLLRRRAAVGGDVG